MKGAILTHGLIAGLLIAFTMFLGLNQQSQEETPQFSQWAGYLIMIVALSLIFIGIKRYRDKQLGGVIKFGTAFVLGLGITAVASVIYVVGWEINLSLTDYAFAEDYSRSVIAGLEAKGVGGAELEAEIARMEQFKQQYSNPLFRVPVTFLEILPVGLIIALISAAVLRNSRILPARQAATSAAAAE